MTKLVGKDGKLLPSTVSSTVSSSPVRLNIIKPPVPAPAPSAVVKPKRTRKPKDESEEDEDGEDDQSDSSGSENEEGYYVEISVTCNNDEGEEEEHPIICNYKTEENYMEHADNGFDSLENCLRDAIASHFPLLEYADQWEDVTVHGDELPEDHDDDMIVVDVE